MRFLMHTSSNKETQRGKLSWWHHQLKERSKCNSRFLLLVNLGGNSRTAGVACVDLYAFFGSIWTVVMPPSNWKGSRRNKQMNTEKYRKFLDGLNSLKGTQKPQPSSPVACIKKSKAADLAVPMGLGTLLSEKEKENPCSRFFPSICPLNKGWRWKVALKRVKFVLK